MYFPEDEPTTQPVIAYDFNFEKYLLLKDEFKCLMLDKIMLYHSDEAIIKYIKEKEAKPGGALHLKYGHHLRKVFKKQ